MTGDTGWRAMLARATDEHGPALNVIIEPVGACQVCAATGPASVHVDCLVWLACGHIRALPALHIKLTSQRTRRTSRRRG